jgi:GNAT superfamily N-acetyltransferase
VIECRTMASAERFDAFTLMSSFRTDQAALGDALALFIDRPDYGFVWLAYDDGAAAACVSVALGISTEGGGLVATLRDLWVAPALRRRGVGSALLATLRGRLLPLEVVRVEAASSPDAAPRALFARVGYVERSAIAVSLDLR